MSKPRKGRWEVVGVGTVKDPNEPDKGVMDRTDDIHEATLWAWTMNQIHGDRNWEVREAGK